MRLRFALAILAGLLSLLAATAAGAAPVDPAEPVDQGAVDADPGGPKLGLLTATLQWDCKDFSGFVTAIVANHSGTNRAVKFTRDPLHHAWTEPKPPGTHSVLIGAFANGEDVLVQVMEGSDWLAVHDGPVPCGQPDVRATAEILCIESRDPQLEVSYRNEGTAHVEIRIKVLQMNDQELVPGSAFWLNRKNPGVSNFTLEHGVPYRVEVSHERTSEVVFSETVQSDCLVVNGVVTTSATPDPPAPPPPTNNSDPGPTNTTAVSPPGAPPPANDTDPGSADTFPNEAEPATRVEPEANPRSTSKSIVPETPDDQIHAVDDSALRPTDQASTGNETATMLSLTIAATALALGVVLGMVIRRRP